MAMNNEKMASGKFSMKPGSKNVSSEGTFRMDSPLKQLGFQPQGGSPMMDKSNKRKLGTEGMSASEKVAYYKKQAANSKKKAAASKGKKAGIKVKADVNRYGEGRSTKRTDLLKEGKKAYNKVKSYFKS